MPRRSAQAAALAGRTFELTDFLVNVLAMERVPGSFVGTDHVSRFVRRPARNGRQGAATQAARGDAGRRAAQRWRIARRAAASAVRSRSSSARSPRGWQTTSASNRPGERRGRRRSRRSRLHAEHRGPAAPARRRAHASAARRRGAGRRGRMTRQAPASCAVFGAAARRARRARRKAEMQVASMHFKERAHREASQTPGSRRTCQVPGQVRPARRHAIAELDDFEGTREAARRCASARSTTSTSGSTLFEENARARGATVLYAQTPADVNALVLEIAAATRCARSSSRSRWCPRSPRWTMRSRRRASAWSRPTWASTSCRSTTTSRRRTSSARRCTSPGTRSPTCSTQATARRARTDIDELCLEARGVLREHYLTADMGISGGNFFVAEIRLRRARDQRGQRDAGDDAAAASTSRFPASRRSCRRWRTSPR